MGQRQGGRADADASRHRTYRRRVISIRARRCCTRRGTEHACGRALLPAVLGGPSWPVARPPPTLPSHSPPPASLVVVQDVLPWRLLVLLLRRPVGVVGGGGAPIVLLRFSNCRHRRCRPRRRGPRRHRKHNICLKNDENDGQLDMKKKPTTGQQPDTPLTHDSPSQEGYQSSTVCQREYPRKGRRLTP